MQVNVTVEQLLQRIGAQTLQIEAAEGRIAQLEAENAALLAQQEDPGATAPAEPTPIHGAE